MLATANMIPDLPVISNTTNVIVDISRQSLQVASLIHKYMKLSSTGDLTAVCWFLEVSRWLGGGCMYSLQLNTDKYSSNRDGLKNKLVYREKKPIKNKNYLGLRCIVSQAPPYQKDKKKLM